MKNNGQMDDIEIIPDLENEMIEEQPSQSQMPPPPRKKGGCGCNKGQAPPPVNKEMMPNCVKVALVLGGLALLYFLFKNKKGKVKVPKVEVGE